LLDDLENEYNICSMFERDEVIKKIKECNYDKAKINKWIEESL